MNANDDRKLPEELTDTIIDFVAGDRCYTRHSALRSCSLTCQGWRARSQFHLFRYQWIDTEEKLLSVLDYSEDVRFAAYLRELDFEPPRPWTYGGKYGRFYTCRWTAILQTFRRLREIAILNVVLPMDIPADWGSGIYATSITQLTLWRFRSPTCQSIPELLVGMPNLQHLKLQSVQWSCEGHEESHVAMAHPVLKRLTADNFHTYEVLGCLSERLDWSRLERLSVIFFKAYSLQANRDIIYTSPDALGRIAQAANTSLQEAWLEIPDMTGVANIDFSHEYIRALPALRNLTFSVDLLGFVREYNWILRMLEDMDPSRLHTLTLVMKIGHPEQLNYIDWERMESILLGPSFESFSKLIAAVPPTAYQGTDLDDIPMLSIRELQQAMAGHLPALVERQALHVESCRQIAWTWNDLYP